MPVIFFSSDDVGDSLSVCGFFLFIFCARFLLDLLFELSVDHLLLQRASWGKGWKAQMALGGRPNRARNKIKPLEAAFSREHIIFTSENVEQRRSGWFDE